MKSLRFVTAGLLGILSPTLPAQQAPHDYLQQADQHWPLLEDYCTDCHNLDDFYGGVAFDLMAPEGIPEEAEIWEEAVRKLRGRLMPPPGSEQPSQAEINGLVAWLENSLDATAAQHPRAGHVPVQRLNRTEFARAVEQLLAVEVNPADFLPAEIEVDGFENIAAALSVSPTFLDQYINAARFIAHRAVGEPEPKLANAYYQAYGNSGFQDGLPLGTTGGFKVEHNFPADGIYRINILDLDVGLYPRSVEVRQDVLVLIDGEEVFRENLGGTEDMDLANRLGAPGWAQILERFSDIRVPVTAGTHEVVFTFQERALSQSDSTVGDSDDFGRSARFLDGVEIIGPYDSPGVSMTPSRERIFVCQPASAAEEQDCAGRIIANLAGKAFRREVSEADIASYMPFFEQGRQGPGGFDRGIEYVVAAILVSPDFLYRGISPDKDIGDAHYFALSPDELATRMSFFLWGVGPDAALMQAAASGRLDSPDGVQDEVERMLADPRAEHLVENFAMRWLNVDDKDAVEPDAQIFPQYSTALNDDVHREVQLYLQSILLEERPVSEILTASHTFLNDRLARHYGIAGVYGAQFRQVELEDPRRWGILGKSAVLLRTSYPDRTSPVLRGAWVLEKIIGSPPAPPPPGVETDLTVKDGEKPTTLRARLEKHRENPTCNQCHGVIDPLGLALENYTVLGQWRDRDIQANEAINANTILPSGEPLSGPVELREYLSRSPGRFAQALTEKLMMFALNRELEYFDMPQVRAIVRQAGAEDYTLSSIINGIVNSSAFRLQALPEGEERIALSGETHP